MNDKLALAKTITKFVVGTSVGSIVTRAVKVHVPSNNAIEEIQLFVAAYALGGMVSDKALDWADVKFLETVEFVNKLKSDDKESSTH